MKEEKMNWMENLGRAIIPKKWREDVKNYFAATGMLHPPYKLIALIFFVSIAISGFIFFYIDFYSLVQHMNVGLVALLAFLFWFISTIVAFSVMAGGIYFYLNLKMYNRIKEIETKLPDYLILVSTNLKGGMSFEKALLGAIKPEFGILSNEMSLVSKKVMTGSDLKDALIEMTQKYDSPTLQRTFNIISGEIESGGKIAYVLDSMIDNLRKTKNMKEEMAANTLMFTIFIGAIVIFISPLLFALSLNLLEVLIGVADTVGGIGGQGNVELGFEIDEIDMDPEEFQGFSILALGIISLASSMIISIIQKGDIKGGIKYIPFFLVSTIILYFFFVGVLEGFFDII